MPSPESINGCPRLSCSRRREAGEPLIGTRGRNKPYLFHCKRAINGPLGCGNRCCFAVRLARNGCARDRSRPFPHVAADTLHERVFDLSIFRRHGAEAICTAGTVEACGGLFSTYNPPATSRTATSAIASIAVTSSSPSFIVIGRVDLR